MAALEPLRVMLADKWFEAKGYPPPVNVNQYMIDYKFASPDELLVNERGLLSWQTVNQKSPVSNLLYFGNFYF